jgi:hypothetical protein
MIENYQDEDLIDDFGEIIDPFFSDYMFNSSLKKHTLVKLRKNKPLNK